MNVHRKNLVKEKNNSMVQKFVSIAIVFPLEFQDSRLTLFANLLPTLNFPPLQYY